MKASWANKKIKDMWTWLKKYFMKLFVSQGHSSAGKVLPCLQAALGSVPTSPVHLGAVWLYEQHLGSEDREVRNSRSSPVCQQVGG